MILAISLARGEAEGAPLKLDEPLSFWGGLDPATGLVIDRWHAQVGASVAGRVLLMPGGRGSSSGSAALAEAIRLGNGPAAILLTRRDAIVIVGALVAAELYGASCPVALVEGFEPLARAELIRVRAEAARAEIWVA
jgi:predicted aconitase with swiveling domain